MEESWQTLFRFVIVFMKVGHRDRAKTEAESAAANGEGGGHEKKKKKKKQRSKKGKNQEAKAEPPSGAQTSVGRFPQIVSHDSFEMNRFQTNSKNQFLTYN